MDLLDEAYDYSRSIGVDDPPRAWLDYLADLAPDWSGIDYSDYRDFCEDERVGSEVERRACR